MDDSTFQIAINLRLGLALCKPYCCHHSGCEVTAFATHGLSCVQSQGRYHRHSSLNDIIHRALGTSQIPSRLEPSGISHLHTCRIELSELPRPHMNNLLLPLLFFDPFLCRCNLGMFHSTVVTTIAGKVWWLKERQVLVTPFPAHQYQFQEQLHQCNSLGRS